MKLRRDRRGQSVIEFTFMAPWLLFLFVGVFDLGFFSYALIATQNAARAAAVHNSISQVAAKDLDLSGCGIALAELQSTANARSLGNCNQGAIAPNPQGTSVVFSKILQVESDFCPGSSSAQASNPNCPSTIPFDAAQVIVTYYTAFLIPIPGLLPGQLKITRTALMQVNPSADF
jgi:Flp pilus assembly protein TadG